MEKQCVCSPKHLFQSQIPQDVDVYAATFWQKSHRLIHSDLLHKHFTTVLFGKGAKILYRGLLNNYVAVH